MTRRTLARTGITGSTAVLILVAIVAAHDLLVAPEPLNPLETPAAVVQAMSRAVHAGVGHMPRTDWLSLAFWDEKARTLLRPSRMARTDWHAGVFWSGVLAAYEATGDEDFYSSAREWAARTNWRMGPRYQELADSLVVGQPYLVMYGRERHHYMVADLQAHLHPYFDAGQLPPRGRKEWWWADALFMAPPVLAELGRRTTDSRYFLLLEALYWDAKDHLFDPTHRLFFQSAHFLTGRSKSPGGKPVFWGRGNAWVYAGLIRTLDGLPATYEHRHRYIELFRDMTSAILQYQQPDGMWRASLIEPEWVPAPESTSTALFAYGLLAGVNRGYLDRDAHLPHALRAWRGLASLQRADGGVRNAQPPANAPQPFPEESVTAYGQGTFLLAASEFYRLEYR